MSFSFRAYLLFVISCLLFPVSSCFAQQIYTLTDTSIVHRLDTYVSVFIDPSDSIGIDKIVDPAFQSNFKSREGNLTFGYLKSTIWIKVNLKRAKAGTQWYLDIPAPFLEYVDFYQRIGNVWDHSMSGYYRAQSLRKISHSSQVLPLQFGDDSMTTVYVKIGGLSPKTFPLYAIEKEKFIEIVRFEDVGYGIFFGILIVMFFYNLFIYLTLRQENYLLYICTIICTFLIFTSASGYAGKFLWPEHPQLNFYAGRLTLGVLAVVLSIFTIRFLEVHRYSKVMYYALLSLIPLGILATILVATKVLSSAGNNLISISTLIFMTTGIVCRIKGNKTATYFIAAWTIYLIGGLLLTLRNSGVFNFNFWTTHFVEIGATLETIIIAFALADRYRRLRIEKEEAQHMALELQFETTNRLELKVRERTEQLSKANVELRATVQTNELQTKLIEDKNAELDAFFYRISHDLKGPISSLLGLSLLAKMEVKEEVALSYLDKQHGQIERLNNIITGLINLTQLNHADLHKQKIDFSKMIDDCILSFRGFHNFGSLIFRKDVEPGLEFYSEWTLLNAILQNLIENAIKYASRQEPYVQIAVHNNDQWVVIVVADNGQGIPSEHQSRIFEMFFRATQNASGTGLGLYILKRSVDRLKGTIDIESEVGVGSTFTVKLPRQIVA